MVVEHGSVYLEHPVADQGATRHMTVDDTTSTQAQVCFDVPKTVTPKIKILSPTLSAYSDKSILVVCRKRGITENQGTITGNRQSGENAGLPVSRGMVARDGFEPPTPAFSGPRSTPELPGQHELSIPDGF